MQHALQNLRIVKDSGGGTRKSCLFCCTLCAGHGLAERKRDLCRETLKRS